MTVQSSLCQTWSETQGTGFLASRLNIKTTSRHVIVTAEPSGSICHRVKNFQVCIHDSHEEILSVNYAQIGINKNPNVDTV